VPAVLGRPQTAPVDSSTASGFAWTAREAWSFVRLDGRQGIRYTSQSGRAATEAQGLPQSRVCMREMPRVCAPRRYIATGTLTSDSLVGRLFEQMHMLDRSQKNETRLPQKQRGGT
jgi:hypothetical protein